MKVCVRPLLLLLALLIVLGLFGRALGSQFMPPRQLACRLLLGGLSLYAILCGGLLVAVRRGARPSGAQRDEHESDISAPPKEMPDSASAADFQQQAFDALLSISDAIEDEPSTDAVFRQAVIAVREATGFDSVAMRTYEPDCSCFRLMAQNGMSQAMVQELACIPADKGFQAEVAQTKRPAVSSDLATDPRLGGRSALAMGYRSLACVPLLAGGDLMGTMELASPKAYQWTPEKIRWLSLVGRSVGVFLHHVEMTFQMRDLAVLKERSLIAREIHDGLAQLIGSIYVWAEDAQLSLEEGDTDAAEIALKRIDRASRDAYAVLREEMLDLRDTPLPGQGLIPYLQKYLDRFQKQWGITAQLVVADSTNGHVAPAAEIQLLRILQEVLTNVRRHACATTVRLTMAKQDVWLVVDVEDDGQGFDLQEVGDGHLGLSIMRERAASVGGHLKVKTEPGRGTHVRVALPPRSNP